MLPETARLLRHVKNNRDWLTWSADEGRWIPQVRSNNALRFNDDLSTFWREHLEDAHGDTPEAALGGRAGDLVYQITSGQAIELGDGIATEHTPNETMAMPLGCAHSSVWCEDRRQMDKGQKRIFDSRLAAKFVLVHGTPPPPQPGA